MHIILFAAFINRVSLLSRSMLGSNSIWLPLAPESDFMHLWKINFRTIVYFGFFFFFAKLIIFEKIKEALKLFTLGKNGFAESDWDFYVKLRCLFTKYY